MDIQTGAIVLILPAEDPIPVYSDICTYCRHWNVGPGRTCVAFPAGIPSSIWMGENNHQAPYEGDNGLQFTAKGGRKSLAAKVAPDPRDAAERRLLRALEKLFATLVPDIAERLARGEMPSDAELQDAFAKVIEPELVETATEEFARLGVDIGVQFDPAMASLQAARWARTYTYDLVKGLTETTRATLQDALGRFQETPGMTRAQLEALIEPAFGARRAALLSSTEITRSYSQAMVQYQQEIAKAGITMLRRWETLADELVCPICGPLHHTLETEWGVQFPGGPPAHPACRCSVTLTAGQ